MTGRAYHYRIFGLKASSEYELPELEIMEPPEPPDIRILLGETPQSLPEATVAHPRLQIATQSLVLRVQAVGDFWVRNGDEITLNPIAGAPPENVRLFLLGSAFGALLHQRGILPIHGSALVFQKRAFILTGDTGAGKSTLAAALVRKGCKILTDDIAAITFAPDGTPWVQPAYPQQKLWSDSATALDLSIGRLIRVMGGEEKYAVPSVERYHSKPEALMEVFHLSKPGEKHTEKICLSPIRGVEKVSLMISNVYRAYFAKGLGVQDGVWRQCFRLAEKVKTMRVHRTKDFGGLKELSELVLEDLTIQSCAVSAGEHEAE
jgi:hypothetical protein